MTDIASATFDVDRLAHREDRRGFRGVSMKKKYWKIPPELVDGQHYTIDDFSKDGCDRIAGFLWQFVMDNDGPQDGIGEVLEFKVIEMTDEEVEEMHDI